jgi:hypothetical protein
LSISGCPQFSPWRFIEELRMIPKLFEDGHIFLFIHALIQVPVSSIEIFIVIPLLLRGHVSGLVLGLLYWVMGYYTNPVWFIVSREMQVTPDGNATVMLSVINIAYSVISLLILVGFYFYHRIVNQSITNTLPKIHTTTHAML